MTTGAITYPYWALTTALGEMQRDRYCLYPDSPWSHAQLVPEKRGWILYSTEQDVKKTTAMISKIFSSARFMVLDYDQSGITWTYVIRVILSDEDEMMLKILYEAGEVPR